MYYSIDHIACVIIAISSSAINPKSYSYSIAIFSNRIKEFTLNPVAVPYQQHSMYTYFNN